MTKVSKRDQKTAETHGVHPAKAARAKRFLTEFRAELETELLRPKEGYNESIENLVIRLQKFFFGTEESFPYTNSREELRELKKWLENVALQYFMLGAVNLFETCYLVEFGHSSRTGVVEELAATSKRFNLMIRLVNESILMDVKLRRFTEDEQNHFMHRK